MLEKFYSFLIENKATNAFFIEAQRYIPTRNVDGYIKRELHHDDGIQIFERAFDWGLSLRGYRYWNKLNTIWKSHYENQ